MQDVGLKELLERIKSRDPNERTAAWQSAGKIGASAILALAEVIVEANTAVDRLKAEGKNDELGQPLEVARAARRAIWQIVRTVGAPGKPTEDKRAVEAELIRLIRPEYPRELRREAVWMLSEIGGDASILAITDIPNIVEDAGKDGVGGLREDARCCVQRIGTPLAIETLTLGMELSKDDFRFALAESLRALGLPVDPEKYPSKKLVPTKETQVKWPSGS